MIQAIERLGFEDIYMRGSVTEEFIPNRMSTSLLFSIAIHTIFAS